jgi:MFS family permease
LLTVSFLLNVMGCLTLASGVHSVFLAVIAVGLIGTGCGLPYAALFTRAGALVPGRAGAAMGLVNMLGIVMILVGAPVAGRLADWTGSFRSSFFALAIFSLVACAAVSLISRNEPAASL